MLLGIDNPEREAMNFLQLKFNNQIETILSIEEVF